MYERKDKGMRKAETKLTLLTYQHVFRQIEICRRAN